MKKSNLKSAWKTVALIINFCLLVYLFSTSEVAINVLKNAWELGYIYLIAGVSAGIALSATIMRRKYK